VENSGCGLQLKSLGPQAGKYPAAGVEGLGHLGSDDPGKQLGGHLGSVDPL